MPWQPTRNGGAVFVPEREEVVPKQPSLPLNRNDKIELVSMHNDPDELPPGATGTINFVGSEIQGSRQYGVKWDAPHAHRTLMICVPPDVVRVLA